MKLKKRKLKFAAIFGICWFALLVLLVDGILKFQTLVDYFGSDKSRFNGGSYYGKVYTE